MFPLTSLPFSKQKVRGSAPRLPDSPPGSVARPSRFERCHLAAQFEAAVGSLACLQLATFTIHPPLTCRQHNNIFVQEPRRFKFKHNELIGFFAEVSAAWTKFINHHCTSSTAAAGLCDIQLGQTDNTRVE